MNNKRTLLIVDNDPEVRNLLKAFFETHNFKVHCASNSEQMFSLLQQQIFDLIILDILLNNENGIDLCKKLRRTSNLPIIIITALSEISERVMGLEAGADDYICKPFNTRELLARVNATLRRIDYTQNQAIVIEFANFTFNTRARELYSEQGDKIELSSGLYELLSIFLQHPQRLLSRSQLFNLTHENGLQPDSFARSIDIQVSRLRTLLKQYNPQQTFIKTVRNQGYMLTVDVQSNQERLAS